MDIHGLAARTFPRYGERVVWCLDRVSKRLVSAGSLSAVIVQTANKLRFRPEKRFVFRIFALTWRFNVKKNQRGMALGWRRGLLGGHADDGYYVLSSIAPVIDEFIDDYLRVNESACDR